MLFVHSTVAKHLQELRCGEQGTSPQVHGVFEHEEEVQVTHQVPCQFIYKPAQYRKSLANLRNNIQLQHV